MTGKEQELIRISTCDQVYVHYPCMLSVARSKVEQTAIAALCCIVIAIIMY